MPLERSFRLLKKKGKQTNKTPNSHYLYSKYEELIGSLPPRAGFLAPLKSYLSVGLSWLQVWHRLDQAAYTFVVADVGRYLGIVFLP